MNFPTQIERDLFESLSPGGRAEVEEHFAALEADPPNECPNCGRAIADGDSFCDDDCKDAWWGIDKMQIERERIAGQREDAAEAQHERTRENLERQMEHLREMKGE
jgi:predicted nucleic acid-binding Zn ribbon protein